MPKFKLTFDNNEEMEFQSQSEMSALIEALSKNEFTRITPYSDGHEKWVNSRSVREVECWPDPPQVGDGIGARRPRRRDSGSGSPT